MDCNTARLLLELSRPSAGELDAAEDDALQGHLRECPACGAAARAERQADERLAAAMRDVPIPDGLRDRLLTRLDQERRGWYRRWPLRHPRAAAVAAALLAAVVGLGVYWANRPRPVIDVEVVLDQALAQRGATAEAVERWFRDRYGARMVAPPQFNYAFLDSYDLNGERLPQLLFLRGGYRAYVRILPAGRFDLNASLRQSRAGSGGYTVELLPHPSDPNALYLVEYTGGSLDWFLAPNAQPA
jgi:hypothetical protein